MDTALHDLGVKSKNETVIALLESHLAASIDLQLQIKQLLWNLRDPQVTEVWWLINAANEFDTFCDLIAARLRSLGTHAQATLKNAQARSFLDPAPPAVAGERECFRSIILSLGKLRDRATQARARTVTIRDETTAKLFAKLATALDAQIWFLGSPRL
jgi:DNA-binding ferritin-like protein